MIPQGVRGPSLNPSEKRLEFGMLMIEGMIIMAIQPTPPLTYPPQTYGFNKALLRDMFDTSLFFYCYVCKTVFITCVYMYISIYNILIFPICTLGPHTPTCIFIYTCLMINPPGPTQALASQKNCHGKTKKCMARTKSKKKIKRCYL